MKSKSHRSDYYSKKELDILIKRFMPIFSPEERLQGLSPEERLQGLSPEERLQDLSLEEFLSGLSDEKRRQLRLLLENQRNQTPG